MEDLGRREIITSNLDVSRLSEDKFCVLPGSRYIRISSTNGGHTVVIGYKPIRIPQCFVAEALGKNAITETQLNTITERLSQAPDPALEQQRQAQEELSKQQVNQIDNMPSEQRYALIKQALLPILKAGKVEDFTQQGIPKVESISASCGFDVTGAERDAAFNELKDSPLLNQQP